MIYVARPLWKKVVGIMEIKLDLYYGENTIALQIVLRGDLGVYESALMCSL